MQTKLNVPIKIMRHISIKKKTEVYSGIKVTLNKTILDGGIIFIAHVCQVVK